MRNKRLNVVLAILLGFMFVITGAIPVNTANAIATVNSIEGQTGINLPARHMHTFITKDITRVGEHPYHQHIMCSQCGEAGWIASISNACAQCGVHAKRPIILGTDAQGIATVNSVTTPDPKTGASTSITQHPHNGNYTVIRKIEATHPHNVTLICSVCGKVLDQEQGTFTEIRKVVDDNHLNHLVHMCSQCGIELSREAGYSESCSLCNPQTPPPAGHEHKFVAMMGGDSTGHTIRCSECGYIEKGPHTFVTKTEGTTTVRVCSECNYREIVDPVPTVPTPINDKIAPTGSVSINNGQTLTLTNVVSLTLKATDNRGGSGVVGMEISNYPDMKDKVSVAYTEKYDGWQLTPQDGLKTVYIRFIDAAGNTSKAFMSRITLKDLKNDKTAPIGIVQINKGQAATESDRVTLTLKATDNVKDSVASMEISNYSDMRNSVKEAYISQYQWQLLPGNGLKWVYVRFVDKAGNVSRPCTDSITLKMPQNAMPTPTEPAPVPEPTNPGKPGDSNGTDIATWN